MNLSQLKLKIKLKQNNDIYQSWVAVAQEMYGDLSKDNFDNWNLMLYKLEHSGESVKAVTKEMKSRVSD